MVLNGRGSTSGPLRRALGHRGLAAVVLAAAALAGAARGRAPDPAPAAQVAQVAPVALAELPAQAQTTYRLILAGGPFPFPKDGIVFGNRERQLPAKARGYYREYTVKTPGAHDRGARRIVCGGAPPSRPEACYFTADHYTSFRRIIQ